MGINTTLYNVLFRRNATMLVAVFGSAFAMQLAFDSSSDYLWNNVNKGRQWKDIKAKYITTAEDEE